MVLATLQIGLNPLLNSSGNLQLQTLPYTPPTRPNPEISSGVYFVRFRPVLTELDGQAGKQDLGTQSTYSSAGAWPFLLGDQVSRHEKEVEIPPGRPLDGLLP